jgi:hypothetical protein
MQFRAFAAVFAGVLGLCAAASAADMTVPPPPAPVAPTPSFLSELRLGIAAHDPAGPESGSVDLNGEILFAKPFRATNPIWDLFIPRFHVGGSANFAGLTSFGYAGLTWTVDITPALFVEGTFGGAVHNGDTHLVAKPGRDALGCSPLFRESASVGLRLDARWAVMATVEHMSNAGLCSQNRGLTNVGVRLGYTF